MLEVGWKQPMEVRSERCFRIDFGGEGKMWVRSWFSFFGSGDSKPLRWVIAAALSSASAFFMRSFFFVIAAALLPKTLRMNCASRYDFNCLTL